MIRRFRRERRGGQTMIFMVIVVFILLLVALWGFDLHKVIYVKHITRNAGDAAALAGARWQGVTLNLIGELNVMQAVVITEALGRGDFDPSVEARAIGDLQARLSFVGPMVGVAAAQQAAKNNGLYVNDSFTDSLDRHAQDVRRNYPQRYPYPPFGNSAQQAWADYAGMLSAVAAQGVAAYPENTQFFTDYSTSEHMLFNPSFYDAISTANWCWFYHNAMALLEQYDSWEDWSPLPSYVYPYVTNSEYFALHLRRIPLLWLLPLWHEGFAEDDIDALLDQIDSFADEPVDNEVANVWTQWFCYHDERWVTWEETLPEGFPFLSDVKPEYDYAGADAAVRIEARADPLTPGAADETIMWTAAAKPFGYLEDGAERVPPNRYAMVLPAFHEARLIPVDASSAPAGGSRPGWIQHVEIHLPRYMARGLPGLSSSCWYCSQLRLWERDDFRQAGLDWLDEYSSTCTVVGGPGGPGGGSRRGH